MKVSLWCPAAQEMVSLHVHVLGKRYGLDVVKPYDCNKVGCTKNGWKDCKLFKEIQGRFP